MTIGMKTRVMNTCLVPSLTYACQTWKFTRKEKNKITSCQRSMERSMLKIKKIQIICHTMIRQKTKAIDTLSYLKAKMAMAKHVVRLSYNRWTTKTTLWAGPSRQKKKRKTKCTLGRYYKSSKYSMNTNGRR
ncbi:Putative uncharacterized transposon-derived protein F52C9.6 [Eumeta japonica]|uniref:Uncharacterized transposon-derived protein F52C9.6 n=1 Tax=Eumeta variegata TaxID=151549 RepID=A0A4C1ZID4_EUMVA|nr:Putative uncharacterized transposon-derived protein F52C9.6 [Eumeta japonica]